MDEMSTFDVGGSKSGKKAEDFYHGFVLGLLNDATKRGVIIKSNELASPSATCLNTLATVTELHRPRPKQNAYLIQMTLTFSDIMNDDDDYGALI